MNAYYFLGEGNYTVRHNNIKFHITMEPNTCFIKCEYPGFQTLLLPNVDSDSIKVITKKHDAKQDIYKTNLNTHDYRDVLPYILDTLSKHALLQHVYNRI